MSTSLSDRPSTRTTDPTSVSSDQRTAEAKEAFLASLKSTGSTVDKELRSRAEIIHANAKNLDAQDASVAKDTKRLEKEGDAMEKFLDKLEGGGGKGVSGFDVQGWEKDIEALERDLDFLDEVMDDVEGKGVESDDDVGEAEASGTGSATSHEPSISADLKDRTER
jgi:hypothetical protein